MKVDLDYKFIRGNNFWEMRAVFQPLASKRDRDPRTKKLGVCAYTWFVALFMRIFGKVVDIPVQFEAGKVTVLHLNKHSLDKWLKRYGGRICLSSEHYLEAILEICAKHKAAAATPLPAPSPVAPKRIKRQAAEEDNKKLALAPVRTLRDRIFKKKKAALLIQKLARRYFRLPTAPRAEAKSEPKQEETE